MKETIDHNIQRKRQDNYIDAYLCEEQWEDLSQTEEQWMILNLLTKKLVEDLSLESPISWNKREQQVGDEVEQVLVQEDSKDLAEDSHNQEIIFLRDHLPPPD